MVNRSKYKRVTDLYVEGTELVLKDGTVMWLQVPNPFQYDEARHDAAVAKSRLTLALKTHGDDEMVKLRGAFEEHGVEGAVDTIVSAKHSDFLVKAYEDIRADPDWRERAEIIDRGDELLARAPEDSERKLLLQIGEEYTVEISQRITEQAENERHLLTRMTEDEVWKEFQNFYIERRGGELSLAEYRLTEVWFAARCCDGVQRDGEWDHAACDGHQVQVFEGKADVRSLPADLQSTLGEALSAVVMTEYEAKKKPSKVNGSPSSPQPSEAAESTPSTPVEIPDEHLGRSTQPSLTH